MYDRETLKKLRDRKDTWEETALRQSSLRLPERKKDFVTTSSEPIERLYSPLDVADLDYFRDLGFPGEYPFTRGVHPTLHRSRLWTMRMFAGFGSAEETNKRFKYLLGQCQTGLSVAFDLATLMGYDTDQPEAEGEFGVCGVALSSLQDMEILFDGIPLEKVSTSMTINSPAAPIWAMYIAAAEKQGVRPEQLRGTIQNDILKEYIAQKEYIFPPEPSMRLVVDTIEYGTTTVPQWNTISISGYHLREAGSPAPPDLACTPTAWMKPWRCLPSTPPPSPCARSRSSPRSQAPQTRSIPWVDHSLSRARPIASKPRLTIKIGRASC